MVAITAKAMRETLCALGDPDIAAHSAGFFKTGKAEYGEGDHFLGIRIPVIRQHVRKFWDAPERAVLSLLKSKYHEERMLAVLLLVEQFSRGDEDDRARIYELYMGHRGYVNNWDLVDSSAHKIVGPWLQDRDRGVLYDLVKAELRDDDHDLIHKAVGWMLREIGSRDRAVEEDFLGKHYKRMPRTMLRYAIEKFPEPRRKAYLYGKV